MNFVYGFPKHNVAFFCQFLPPKDIICCVDPDWIFMKDGKHELSFVMPSGQLETLKPFLKCAYLMPFVFSILLVGIISYYGS